jgi:peptidoglycan/LPS O-acetylase OafA/YrhL
LVRTGTVTGARIRGFDGLRALAVTAVFLTHRTTLGHRLELGSQGVWLFFVLSGFLIIGILDRDRAMVEARGVGFGTALWSFVSRRARRIFPVYYLTLLTIVPLLVATGVVLLDRHGAVMLATYLTNIWIGMQLLHWPKYLGHLWSLAIEEQFYLLMPWIALALPRRWLPAACGAIVALGIATKLWLTFTGAPYLTIYTNSLIGFAMIAYGGLCRLALRGDVTREGHAAWPVLLPLAAYVAANLGATLLHVPRGWMQATPLLAGLALVGIARNQASWPVALLELSPLTGLGRVSYGFYVYHPLICLNTLIPLLAAFGVSLAMPEHGAALISFAMALGVSLLSWRLIERPLLAAARTVRAPALHSA